MPTTDVVLPESSGVRQPHVIGTGTRITLLLAITAASLICLLLVIQGGWRRQVELLLHERVEETDRVLRRALDLRANGARVHADDYTRWDDFVTFAHTRDPEWGNINITRSIATFDLDVAWVLDSQFHCIFTANPTNDSRIAPLPVSEQALAQALHEVPIRHFFTQSRRGLLEVWTSPIQPSDDFARKTPVQGYYIISRLWTTARIGQLDRDCNATIRVLPPGTVPLTPVVSHETGMVAVAVPLQGIDGHPVATVQLRTVYPLFARVNPTLRISALLVIAGVVLIILAFGQAMRLWIGRPLAAVTEALRYQRPGLLLVVAKRGDEFGQLARLVVDFFEQREHLVAAREAATLAMAAKSQFLANISHELRTPMHGILSYSRFGVKGALTASREELLDDFENIDSCGSSLLSLLDDLLDLAKLEAGRMRFEFAATPLEEVVAEALDEFASVYHDKAVRVDVRAENELEPVVLDRRKILQVIRNLLSNAGKFSPQGGTVWIRLASEEGRARVVIEDSGAGVPESELELIFENFAQASNSKAQSGGTGLGLAICREVVGAHAGRIWAVNRPEGGARITVELPLGGPPVATEQDVLRPGDGSHEQNPSVADSRLAKAPDVRAAA